MDEVINQLLAKKDRVALLHAQASGSSAHTTAAATYASYTPIPLILSPSAIPFSSLFASPTPNTQPPPSRLSTLLVNVNGSAAANQTASAARAHWLAAHAASICSVCPRPSF